MTVQVDIFTLAILLLLVIVMAFLLPMLWQVRKTAHEADKMLSELRRELIPTLRDLREAAEQIKQTSAKIEEGTIKAENILDSMDKTADAVRHISRFLQEDVVRIAEDAACLIWGIRAAGKVFLKGIQEKGG